MLHPIFVISITTAAESTECSLERCKRRLFEVAQRTLWQRRCTGPSSLLSHRTILSGMVEHCLHGPDSWETPGTSGSRTDREATNIKDYLLGLTWGKLSDYGKHCLEPSPAPQVRPYQQAEASEEPALSVQSKLPAPETAQKSGNRTEFRGVCRRTARTWWR